MRMTWSRDKWYFDIFPPLPQASQNATSVLICDDTKDFLDEETLEVVFFFGMNALFVEEIGSIVTKNTQADAQSYRMPMP